MGVQYPLPHRHFGRANWIGICNVHSKLPNIVGTLSIIALYSHSLPWAGPSKRPPWMVLKRQVPKECSQGDAVQPASLAQLLCGNSICRCLWAWSICCLPLFISSISHFGHMWQVALDFFHPVSRLGLPRPTRPGPLQPIASLLHSL